MSYGVDITNISGISICNLSIRLTRFINSYSVSIGSGAILTITVPGLLNDGTWGVIVLSDPTTDVPVGISISPNTITIDNSFRLLALTETIVVFRT